MLILSTDGTRREVLPDLWLGTVHTYLVFGPFPLERFKSFDEYALDLLRVVMYIDDKGK